MKDILLWMFLFLACSFICYSAIKRGIKLKKQGEDLNLIHVSINGSANMDIITSIVFTLVCLGILIRYIVVAINS